MPYLSQLSCVAALLLTSLTGCLTAAPSPVARPPAQSNVPADRYVPGSMDRVSKMMQATLGEWNVLFSSVRDGAGIRFECRTASGARFCLVLVDASPKKDDPRTRVHVGWEHDREPEPGLSDPVVVKILDAVTTKAYEEKRQKDAEKQQKKDGAN